MNKHTLRPFKSKSFKSKSLITGGLLGLAGLGLLPQGAEATTDDLSSIVFDPSLGKTLAEEPKPAIAPIPSAQITAPQMVDQEKPQPAWALEVNQTVAAAATPQLTPASAQVAEAEVAEAEVAEAEVVVASPATLASVPINEAIPVPAPPVLIDPALTARTAAADSDLALPIPAVADPTEAAAALAATPPVSTAAPDLAAIQAKTAMVQARLADSRVAATVPEDAVTAAAAPSASGQVSQPESFTMAQISPSAPEADQIRENLRIDPLTTAATATTYIPSSSAGIPTGFGAESGDFFISATLAGADRVRPEVDGSLYMGFGLGDAQRLVGVELAYNLLSVRRFAENGSFDAKVHREIYNQGNTQVAGAVGVTSAFPYGSNAIGTEASFYGVVSSAHLLQPNHPTNPLTLNTTLGLGSGNFANGDVGILAGVGLRVHPQFAVNTAWSGVGVNVGASIVPSAQLPITLNLLYGDIFNNTTAGSVAVLSIGYGINSNARF